MSLRTQAKPIDEVVSAATLLKWAVDESAGMMWRGGTAIEIEASKAGAILRARRYDFFSLNDLRLVEVAPAKHTKETVLSWLAGA